MGRREKRERRGEMVHEEDKLNKKRRGNQGKGWTGEGQGGY